jgi:hypothetical protein
MRLSWNLEDEEHRRKNLITLEYSSSFRSTEQRSSRTRKGYFVAFYSGFEIKVSILSWVAGPSKAEQDEAVERELDARSLHALEAQ